MKLPFRRYHGRKAALFFLCLSILTSLFSTAYYFDALHDPNLLLDIFLPTLHAKELLALRLLPASEKDLHRMPSQEWEQTLDEATDPRECALNQPQERPRHGCVTDTDSLVPYCQLQNLRVDVSRISGPPGGEAVETVLGRDEEVELPKYLQGAFTTDQPVEFAPDMNRNYWFYLLDVFMALDVTRKGRFPCSSVLTGTSLLVTRYEYVDLFHTLKDWWNAYFALPHNETVQRVIFLDSHAQGYLDSVWAQLFGPTLHIHHLQPQQHADVCLERAVFVPPGYASVLWPLGRLFQSHRCPGMAHAFVKHLVQSHGLSHVSMQNRSIVLLEQAPHVLHPRSNTNDAGANTIPWTELQAKLLDQTEALSVQLVDVYKLHFKAQLKIIRQAQILISTQGSALTLAMFLQEGAHVLEVKQQGNDLQTMLKWRPNVFYHPIYTAGEHVVDYEIVPNVKDILTPGWDADGKRYPEEYYKELEEEDLDYNETDSMDSMNETDDWMNNNNNAEQDALQEGGDLLKGWSFSQTEHDMTEDHRQCALNRPPAYFRPAHGCRVNADTKVPFCRAQQVKLDVNKVNCKAMGGEYVDTVLGRDEDDEFCHYQPGAFVVETALDIPNDLDRSLFYYLKDVLEAFQVSSSWSSSFSCTQTIAEPTLFITRYEYVNLFRTLNDLWNAFHSLPQEYKFGDKLQVVFLDAHAQGYLDDMWTKVFGPVTHVKRLPEGVCFAQAIFVPSGYSSVLWPNGRTYASEPCPAMARAFRQQVLQAYRVQDVAMQESRVAILDRVPYMAHPRSDPSKEDRLITNLNHLQERIQKETDASTVELVNLEQLPLEQQLRTILQSHILMGHEEAGLAHMLFLQDGAHVLELDSATHLAELAKWNPNITHRTMDVVGKELSDDMISNVIIRAVDYAINKRDEEANAER